MKLRMHPLAVEVNEQEEIVISQDKREGGEASTITITMEQVEYLYDLLQRAKKAIDERREALAAEEDEGDRGTVGQRRR
jgi:hypothetical protein